MDDVDINESYCTMANDIVKINISKRFDRNCKVCAFDVKIDGKVYHEVSKHAAFKLIMQVEGVVSELDMGVDVHCQHYLLAA